MMELLFNKIVDLKSEISSNKTDLCYPTIFRYSLETSLINHQKTMFSRVSKEISGIKRAK